jgi:hypothetical protein
MRSEEELGAFFASGLREHVEAWRRMPRIRPPNWMDLVALVTTILFAFAMQRSEALWLGGGYLVLRVMYDVRRVQSAFKQGVLSRVFEFALPGVRYQPHAHIGAEHVRRSGLFRESWNDDAGEDYVAGRHGSTDFWFCELTLARKKKDQRSVVFQGLFFIADFHKTFRGRTYLLPDLAERAFGALGRVAQALRIDGTELVELEDPDFEKRFVCSSTDPLEARYVLSTSMIQRILRIAERSRGALRISFVDECLYLALPSGDLFRAPFLGGSVDEAALFGFVRELRSVLELVEELGLNTRIWSKAAPVGAQPIR